MSSRSCLRIARISALACGMVSALGCAPAPEGAVQADAAVDLRDATLGFDAATTADASLEVGDGADARSLDVPDATTTDAPPEAGDATAPAQSLLCADEGPVASPTDYAEPGPYPVGVLELTFTDDSRPIEATAEHPGAPQRILETRIYYPAASPPVLGLPPDLSSDGPFPLLMWSHGYSSNWDESLVSGTHAASHGYIVVSPTFPLTSLGANGGSPDTKDIPNQPGDISFLIDRMLEFSKDPEHRFAGGVDETRIGALGVSAGGLTTLLVSLHEKHHDPRIRVAMPVAPFAAFFERDYYHATRTIPLLIVHGDMDAFLPYELNGRRAFERASPHARLLTVAKGSHAAFAMPISADLEQLVAALIVPPEWSQDNPDAMGCAGVGEALKATRLDVLETLEGPYVDHDIVIEGDDIVCTGPELTMPAMGIDEQRAILAEAVVSFFDAHLGSTPERRQDGCDYLVRRLPQDPALTLE